MPPPLKARTLLADDHVLLREALRSTLDAEDDFEVVAEASDGAEAVALALDLELDLAVVDISMPKLSGISVARHLATYRPSVRVVVLTMHEREDLLYEALRAGASGYVVKSAAARDLLDVARAALRGQVRLHPGDLDVLASVYVEAAQSGDPEIPDGLTNRELEVLKLVAEGHANDEISAALIISPKTVARHRANILKKLGMHDRVHLTRYAIRRGLIDP